MLTQLISRMLASCTMLFVLAGHSAALLGTDIPGLETVGNICGDTETQDPKHWGVVESTVADAFLKGQIEYIAVSEGGAADPIWPKFQWLQSFETKYTNLKTPILHGTIKKETRRVLSLNVAAGEYLTDAYVHCGRPLYDKKHRFDPASTFVTGLMLQTSFDRQFHFGNVSIDNFYTRSYGKRIIAFHGAVAPISNPGLQRQWITALGVQYADLDFGKWPKTVPVKDVDLSKRLTGPDYRSEANVKKVAIDFSVQGHGGFDWDDLSQTKTDHKRLHRIEGRCAERVDQLTFYYQDNRHPPSSFYPGMVHGGLHGTYYAGITLALDEFVTTVIIDGGIHYHMEFVNDNWRYRVGYLELITSKNQRFVCGKKSIHTITYSFTGRAILAFYGRAHKNVDAMGMYTIPVADY